MTSLSNCNVWRHNWRKFSKKNFWILFPKMTLGDGPKMLPIGVKMSEIGKSKIQVLIKVGYNQVWKFQILTRTFSPGGWGARYKPYDIVHIFKFYKVSSQWPLIDFISGLHINDGVQTCKHNYQSLPRKKFCDIKLLVPSNTTARIQECHIFLGHFILEQVENLIVKKR